MPAAYVITNMKISDPEKYKGYQALTPAAIAAGGGQFLVRGGRFESLEGDPADGRWVVVKFDSYEAAKAFYDSPLYREARARRAGATEFLNMIVIEGVE
ncbi:MAG TPA: DUF1330 domain-containing protein [Burkholderiaceae bacterium]|nr:DUF1330 domain-containing protein [Burkholderiaceae bacterium]